MNDDKRVSDGGSQKIQMDTSTQDSDHAVMKKVSSYSCYLRCSPRWLEQRLNANQLHSTKRKLKRLVSGHTHTYLWVHVAYFGVWSVVGTASLWLCRGKETISFVDCIFNAVSAVTATGLSSVPLRDFTPPGLLTLILLMLVGNTVFVSLLLVYVRRFQFFRHDRALTYASNAAVKLGFNQHNSTDVNYFAHPKTKTSSVCNTNGEAIDISRPDWILKTGDGQGNDNGDGLGLCPEIKSETGKVATCCCGKSFQDEESPLQADHHDNIGLLERQALITLSWLVPIYMFVILAFGFFCIICYTSFFNSKGSSRVRALYEAEEVNPIQTAMFLSVSAFSNTGSSPLDENMIPFAASPLVLIPLAVLILGGNTMFPPILRFIIWSVSILKRTDDPQRKVYEYLLQFPRRCYTLLFPSVHTMWLVVTVVAFNTVDLVAFCALEWNSAAVKADANAGVKLMDGLFQSLNTRSGGMNVLPLSSLSPALLVLYTAMMYISAYPVFLSRHHSRLTRTDVNHQYSDKCVSEKLEATADADNKLPMQFTKLFTRDSVYIFVQVFLICNVERRSLNSDPLNYSILSIVFEVVSAYGSVGLSLGYSCAQYVRASANTPYAEAAAACTDVPYSFSGKWSVASKLILAGGMLLGRHRSIPDDMDAAIPVVTPSQLCDCCRGSPSDAPQSPIVQTLILSCKT